MNAKELYNLNNETGEYKPTGVYYCTNCNHVGYTKEIAEQCCTPTLCKCGKEVKKYWTVCEECSSRITKQRELKKFNDNHKYTNEEYDDEIFIDDDFYENIEYYLEYIYEDNPENTIEDIYAYTAIHEKYSVNVDNVLEIINEWVTDDMEDPELVELNGFDELREALEKFNNAQTGYVIRVNEKEGVLYTKEFLEKLIKEIK